MFQNEAGFSRINAPKYCWTGGKRLTVPCRHIREYRYAFGTVDPISGDSSFWVMPWCNTVCMNIFIDNLSKEYAKKVILLVCDDTPWHKSDALVIPNNIHLIHIPSYTPEINPIEQIWRKVRTRGFGNDFFHSLEDVIKRLCCTIKSITKETIHSITWRGGLESYFEVRRVLDGR